MAQPYGYIPYINPLITFIMIYLDIYEGHTFTVEFVTGHPMRFSQKGKHWPLTTQCIVKRDNLIIGIGNAVKHDIDKHNEQYAYSISAKKAFTNAGCNIWKSVRTNLYRQFLTKVK